MQGSLPHPQATLVVILGASEFPKSSLSASDSFRRSAERFRDYLTSKEKFDLPGSNLLDLFNSNSSATDLDERVGSFLKERIDVLKQGDFPVADVIIYYVGHGGFSDDGTEYFLALRDTRSHNRLWTSYAIKALARTLKEHARNIRKYLILDCCFSAAAYKVFQAGPISVAVRQAAEEFPAKGTALLCASGPRNPAMAPLNAKYTMFSGALLDLLENGSKKEAQNFSLATTGELTRQLIKVRYENEAVRPEVHVPDQPEGSVAALPLFPNQALRPTSTETRLRSAEETIDVIRQGQGVLQASLSAIEETVKALATQLEALQPTDDVNPRVRIASNAEPAGALAYHYGMTRNQWEMVPPDMKAAIRTMRRAKIDGFIWLTLVTTIGALSLLVGNAFGINVGVRQYWLSTLVALQGSMFALSLISFFPIIFERRFINSEKSNYDVAGVSPWEHFDIVVELKNFKDVSLFPGIRVDRRMAAGALLIEIVTGIPGVFTTFVGMPR